MSRESTPQTIEGLPFNEWIDLQEALLFDPGVVLELITSPEWQMTTARFRNIIFPAENLVINRQLHSVIPVQSCFASDFELLQQTSLSDIIPTVGPKSDKLLQKHNILTVRDLVERYTELKSFAIRFSMFCLFLHDEVGLSSHVFFRVALFAHIVSTLILSQSQDEHKKLL